MLVGSNGAALARSGRAGVACCSSSVPSSVATEPAEAPTDGNESDRGEATPHPSLPDPEEEAICSAALLEFDACSVLDLVKQMQDLKSLVNAQADLLYSQKDTIDQLQETIKAHERRLGPLGSAPMVRASVDYSPPSPRAAQAPPSPFAAQAVAYGDRRLTGLYDARFHSTHNLATPPDLRILPERIVLVRHAESEGNVNNQAYTYIPDSQVPLTARGHMQAREAGKFIKDVCTEAHDRDEDSWRLFFYISPYKRSLQTYEGICSQFPSQNLLGVQEEVQLREQDFGNFQDLQGKQREKAERLRFGRFFYRFPNGESGADVYDRITIFEDHMVRDINAGRFAENTSLVLVSHGLALRVFLMRWFHWTVDEFLSVYNPGNAEPIILERVPITPDASWRHTKSMYRLTPDSMERLRGCTEEMCSTDHLPRPGLKVSTRLM